MQAIGIIAEYNPFHKGHLYHLETIKEKYPNAVIIAVMSGDYVQRGEPAIISKSRRAKQAKEAGIDIVIELPAIYSTQSAEIFARASVGILHLCHCEAFVFGSETNNIERLEKIARLSLSKEFNLALKEFLSQGFSYPTAFSKALFGEKIEPNDTLGIEYIKAIWFWKSSMRAESILRKQSGYYEENQKEQMAGATVIRQKIEQKEDYSKYLVDGNYLEEPFAFWDKFYPYLRYALLFHSNSFSEIQDMEEGLENRTRKAAEEHVCYSSFLESIMTKRYTYARIQRVLLHILLGISKQKTERWKEEIPYLRVLEFSERGQEYLRVLKKGKIPVITTKKNIQKKLSEEARELFFWNERASSFYLSVVEEKQ